jgi:hypothetical protein
LAVASILFLAHFPVHGDVQVNHRKDVVVLVDGKRVECVVVMITPRGVLAIVKDPDSDEGARQVLFRKAQVKEVIKGKDEGRVKGFQTDPERARKVVKGTGFRKEKKRPKAKGPIVPTGPIQKAEPIVIDTVRRGSGSTRLPFNSKLSAADLAKAYMARFPGLKKTAEKYLGGANSLQRYFHQALKGNRVVRERLHDFLTKLLENDAASQPGASARPAPKRVPSSSRRPPPRTTEPK